MLFTYYQIHNGLLSKYKDKIRFTSKLIEMCLIFSIEYLKLIGYLSRQS